MMQGAVAKRYAQALFALAQERQEIKKVESELLALKETIEQNPDLKAILYHQLISGDEKKKLIEQLFVNLSLTTLHFIYLVFDRRRDKHLEDMISVYHDMCMEMEDRITAEVTTAVAMSPENKAALIAKFTALTGKKVDLQEEVDPSIIGGIVVTIGDKVYNGSLASRLEALRMSLAKA